MALNGRLIRRNEVLNVRNLRAGGVSVGLGLKGVGFVLLVTSALCLIVVDELPSRTLTGFTRFNTLDPSPLAELAVMPILRAHGRGVRALTALFFRDAANALFAEQMKVVMGEKVVASRTHGNRMVFPSHTFLEDRSDLKRPGTAKVSNGFPSDYGFALAKGETKAGCVRQRHPRRKSVSSHITN